MDKVLVTGANGFIGRALVNTLSHRRDLTVTAGVRTRSSLIGSPIEQVEGLDFATLSDWRRTLSGATCIVHTAGVSEDKSEPGRTEPVCQRVNVDGTLSLAAQAIEVSVRRFIFISTAKVSGEVTRFDAPFTYDQSASPNGAYAVSKYEAEKGLLRVASGTGMDVTIIRPPLVYGPGVKGNFLAMMNWVARGYPLPVGAVHNRRSMVAVGNLVDLIVKCIDHPAARNETFLVSDGDDLSTPDLVRRLGRALGKPARLLPVPVWLIGGVAAVVGKSAVAQRLCGNLQVDISHTRNTLDWRPPVSMDDALKRTAEDFLTSRSGNSKR